MNKLVLLCFLLYLTFIPGCAFLNVDMAPRLQPLQEKILEGEGKNKILLLDISGFISEKETSGNQLVKEKPSMVAEVKEALKKAEGDKDIAGIILRINSPGGTVTASDIIYHEIAKYREKTKKPVYACITGMGTSGGYYVAAATDRIFAHPTAITGSIGVIMLKFNVEGLMSKIGVSETTFKSADKKDLLSPFRSATTEEEKIVQNIINDLHSRFTLVVQNRPGNRLERDQVAAIADGRIYTATQALDAQLIDGIAYLEDVIDALKKSAGIQQTRVITYYRPGSYKGSIYSAIPETSAGFNISIINLGTDLDILSSQQFMYLWRP